MAVKRSGQLVLFRFPQTDLPPGKLRPALLLAALPSGRRDWLVCMISSQIGQAINGVDDIIETNDGLCPVGLEKLPA
jgi:mRNA interferase MazF